uniref:Ribosomal protein L28e n=1 Tax=Oxyrrhis marina TaxID=2969 RepID=A7WQK3_OXYMA|nr:ribosomal protein L28e [Oxyrrhis marina]|mmetsp:Transcript_2126/g.2522  ORF Transcript_2126/g.2522 Transcript_2126/m.2522 type:complete len:133 (+) Transcript_2126:21-419(+)
MAELVWACMKNSNCYSLKSRNCATLTCEPGNLTNVHNFKYSGTAQDKAVSVTCDDKQRLRLVVKRPKRNTRARPTRQFTKLPISTAPKKALETIKKALVEKSYRPGDVKLAVIRHKKLTQARSRFLQAKAKK